jgi:hypothetical protein
MTDQPTGLVAPDLVDRRFRGVTLFNTDWCAWQAGKCHRIGIVISEIRRTPRLDDTGSKQRVEIHRNYSRDGLKFGD